MGWAWGSSSGGTAGEFSDLTFRLPEVKQQVNFNTEKIPFKLKHFSFPLRYEFFADDLPIWGFVGPPPEQTQGDTNVYIYTHKSFDVAYNGGRVSGVAGRAGRAGVVRCGLVWVMACGMCGEVGGWGGANTWEGCSLPRCVADTAWQGGCALHLGAALPLLSLRLV